MTETAPSNCPKCDAAIAEDAPQGLCPKCVLAEAATLTDESPSARTPPPTVAEIAPHFPDLEVLELIGAGGMGTVYKARQPRLDRLVALKVLADGLSEDPAFVERFQREAQVLAKLNHPHITAVHDFGTNERFCYLVMEYVDGVNLRQAMRSGGFESKDALGIVEDVCAALKFAHDAGVLHRDIKPENILIDAQGTVKIADFGIAKLVGDHATGDLTLTRQGSVLGSPHYMAPEQFEAPDEVDQRADIYSLGVVFYEMLTGELPIGRFKAPSEKSKMDPRVDEVVFRTLEKEREARYQSAGEVKTEVQALHDSPPPMSEPSVQSDSDKPAKRHLLSAILTAVSLILAIASVGIVQIYRMQEAAMGQFIGMHSPEINPLDGFSPSIVVAILCAAIVAIPAIMGVLLGSSALGEIHRSGGRRAGLENALFAVTTWPILVFMIMVGVLSHSWLTTLGAPFKVTFHIAMGVIAGCLFAVFVVPRVSAWARGLSKPGISTKQLFKAAAIVFAVLLVVILLFVG